MNQAEHPRVARGRTAVKRLVVVADNPLIVSAIRSGLRDNGALQFLGYIDTVKATASTILHAEPDVVLVDGEAADPDAAVELIRSLRAHDDDIHIIALTLAMDGEWLQHAVDAGANGAMSKAIRPGALATLIREAANGHVVHAPMMLHRAARQTRDVDAQHASLTVRELEILRLVASGAANAEVARHLWITQQTVKFHLSNVYRKLGVANRTDACRYAHVNELLSGSGAERPVALRERATLAIAS